MRVAFVFHDDKAAGAEAVALEAIAGLVARGHQCHAVVPGGGRVAERAAVLCGSVVKHTVPWWLPDTGSYRAGHFVRYASHLSTYARPVADLIKREQVDVVISTASVILHGAFAALVTRRPHVHYVHEFLGEPGHDLRLPFRSARLAYAVLRAAGDALVFACESAVDDARQQRVDARVAVVRYGWDMSTFDDVRPLAIESRIADEIRVGVLGSFYPRKGSRIIASVVRRACRDDSRLTFHWCGPKVDPEADRILARCEIAGVRRLHLLGYSPSPAAFLAGMDIMLHPAFNETFPRAVVEAGLSRRACVATNCGGTREIVRHDRTGILVAPGDAEGMARAVVKLASNPALRQEMGEAARLALEGLTLSAFEQNFTSVVELAAAAGPSPASSMPEKVVRLLATLAEK